MGHLLKLPSLLKRLLEARVSGHFFFGLLQSGSVSEVGEIVEKRVRGANFGDTERFWILVVGGLRCFWFGVSRHLGRFELEKNPLESSRNR